MLGELYRWLMVNLLEWMRRMWARYQHCQEMANSRAYRLKLVERRLTRLLVSAKLAGLGDYEVAKIVVPHLTDVFEKPKNRKNKAKNNYQLLWTSMIVLMLGLSLMSLVRHCRPCRRLGLKYARLSLFAIEPYWEWQTAYASRCLIPRSSARDHPLPTTSMANQQAFCDFCEEITNITHVDVFNSTDLDETIAFNIANRIPLIIREDSTIRNEIKRWNLFTQFTKVDFLHEIYAPGDGNRFCMFRSNLVDVKDPETFLERAKGLAANSTWFAHWENCKTSQKKKLRRHYDRLSVLPPMLELSHANWLLLSSGSSRSYKAVTPARSSDLLVMVQVSGSIDVVLRPAEQCNTSCAEHRFRLCQFEVLVMNVNHWLLSYKPVSVKQREDHIPSWHTINLSLGLTGVSV